MCSNKIIFLGHILVIPIGTSAFLYTQLFFLLLLQFYIIFLDIHNLCMYKHSNDGGFMNDL